MKCSEITPRTTYKPESPCSKKHGVKKVNGRQLCPHHLAAAERRGEMEAAV